MRIEKNSLNMHSQLSLLCSYLSCSNHFHFCHVTPQWKKKERRRRKDETKFGFLLCSFKGPRYRRPKEKKEKGDDEKRPRTAFSNEQLARLKVHIVFNNHWVDSTTTLLTFLFFLSFFFRRGNSTKIDTWLKRGDNT